MSKNNNLPNSLPDTRKTFSIDLIGRITKKKFQGEFQCKVPTIKDQAMIKKHEAHLNGEFPVYLDSGIQKIHEMIAYLRFTIIDSPMFWRNNDLGYDLRDDNIIQAVYDEVISFENEWLKQIWLEPTPEEREQEAKDQETSVKDEDDKKEES